MKTLRVIPGNFVKESCRRFFACGRKIRRIRFGVRQPCCRLVFGKPRLPNARSLALALALAAIFACGYGNKIDPSTPARAELKPGHKAKLKADPRETPIPYDNNDFLRVALDPATPQSVHWGEPFILKLRLINHTRFTTQVQTNFITGSHFKLHLRPEGQSDYEVKGPFYEGTYPPNDMVLYPFEERPIEITIWGDRGSPNGLTFPQPGKYSLRFQLKLSARLTSMEGWIPAVAPDLRPIQSIAIDVLPPRESTKPLVEKLIELEAFPDLHLNKVVVGAEEEFPALIEKYPATPITPYMDYAAALMIWNQAGGKVEDDEAFEKINYYLQRAAAAESKIKEEALLDLVRVYDKRGEAYLARETAQKLVETVPKDLAALYGSVDVVKKYLINTQEIDPATYWEILE